MQHMHIFCRLNAVLAKDKSGSLDLKDIHVFRSTNIDIGIYMYDICDVHIDNRYRYANIYTNIHIQTCKHMYM